MASNIPNTGAFNAGFYNANAGLAALDHEVWAARVMTQSMKPTSDNLVRLADNLPMGSAAFEGDRGVPFTIMPAFGAKEGTKITFAISDVRIARPNYNQNARRANMGTGLALGKGTLEIFYVDDGSTRIGTGNMQQDGISRKDIALEETARWGGHFIDELLRIPLYGRRGIGGGYHAFYDTETGNGDDAVQPEDVLHQWRGENTLPPYRNGTIHIAGENNTDENGLSGTDFLRAVDISRLTAAIETVSPARNEFPFKKVSVPSSMKASTFGGMPDLDYILFISGEHLETLKKDTGAGGFNFMNFHSQLAASNNPMAAVFWSNLAGNVGRTGIVCETRKWGVHTNASGHAVSYAVLAGADCVRFGYGTAGWEGIGAANRMPMKLGPTLQKFGRMWECVKSAANEGFDEVFALRGYIGTKRNRLMHPKTSELLNHSWAAIAANVQTVRADGEY